MDDLFARFFPNDIDVADAYHLTIQAHLDGARRLLDFGCGRNTDLQLYRGPNREVWGVDLQRHPQLAHPTWFRPLGPAGEAPFPAASFDLIASRWVLEHVADPRRFLAEVGRLLRPGGWFIALTVNAVHYVSLFGRLTDLLPHAAKQQLVHRLYGRPLHDTFPTFYRLNTPGQIAGRCRPAGLRLAEVRHFANPDYFSFSPLLRRCAVLADFLLEKLGHGLGRLYLVVALHKPAASPPQQGRQAA